MKDQCAAGVDLRLGAGHSAVAVLDTGKLEVTTTDLEIATFGPSASLTRTYSSARTDMKYGPRGWRYSFERSLKVDHLPTDNTYVHYIDETGEKYEFLSSGSWWTPPPGYAANLTQGASDWKLKLPSGNTLTFDSDGKLLSEADSNGNTVTYTWDASDKLSTITAANGHTINLTVVSGKITGATYTIGTDIRQVGFATAAPWTVTYFAAKPGLERTVTYTYANQLLTGIKATDYAGTAGLTTTFGYDLLSRTTSAGAQGQTPSRYTYNTLGRQLTVTDADGFATSRSYDEAGRVKSETTAGATTTSVYNPAGLLTGQTDPNDRQTALTYDLFARTTRNTQTLPGTPRVTVKDTSGVYDSLGRLIQSTDEVKHLTHTLTYPQNTASPTTEVDGVGSAGSDLVATSVSVGADGLETSRSSVITANPPVPDLTRTVNTRDAANRVTRATLSTGPSTAFLSQYLYDSAGRVQRQWGPDSGAGAGYLATAATTNAYTYHATTGQKTQESIKLQAVGTAGTITASYTYTGAGRLSTATVNGVADTTVFDPAGNLTGFTGTTLTYQENRLATTVTGGTTTYYFFDAAKRWRVSQGLQNNPADPNRIRYTYTDTGRLATYDKPTDSVSITYTYDAAGQRTAASVTVSGQTTSTSFAYEGLRLLNLSAAQSGGTNPDSWKITYLYDEQGRPYAGVYRQPGTATTPLLFGILTTDRGDVVSLLDAAGTPFAAYRYDAWGNPHGTGNVQTGVWSKSTTLISLQTATDIAKRQPLRYASYCYDSESGLYYLSARSYDPATRQFLSKDLSRNDGEESAYQYCGGNPVAGVDPTGYRMDEFATSQERREAERTRAVKKAKRVGTLRNKPSPHTRRTLFQERMESISSRGSDAFLPTEARNAVAWYEERYMATGNPAYVVGKHLAMPFTERYIGTTFLVMSLGRGGRGVRTGPTVDPATGRQVGRFIGRESGPPMIEPVGGRTVSAGRGGGDTHTLYPNGSSYQRLNPQGHPGNPTPHGHGHLEGTGPGIRGQGPSIDPLGNVVPWNSPAAHWPVP